MNSAFPSSVAFIGIVTCATVACGGTNTLSREEASRQLEAMRLRQVETAYVLVGNSPPDGRFLQVRSGYDLSNLRSNDLTRVLQAGALKATLIETSPPNMAGIRVDRYEITYPDNVHVGELPYPNGRCNGRCAELILAEATSLEILGVSVPAEGVGQVMSTVDYQVTWTRSVVGEALGRPERLVRRHQAYFVKYDDGWRLSN